MKGGRELEIWGGGLAGLSLAVALRSHGVDVSLREKGGYPRHKVCGEFICGVSDETLDSLGIAQELSDAEDLREMAWYHGDERVYHGELSVRARGISRYRLDQRLAERLQELGGNLLTGERCEQAGIPACGVIWAAGRPARPGGSWLGLKYHVRGFELEHDLEMHLGPGGYLGLARIEDGAVNVCGLFRRRSGLRGKMPGLLGDYLRAMGCGQLAQRLESAETDLESVKAVAGFELGDQPGGNGIFAIGDAALMIPPFTGNGMSMAFESAELAARSLLPYCRGEVDWEASRRQFEGEVQSLFQRRMNLAQTLHQALLDARLQWIASRAVAGGLLPVQWLLRRLRAS